MENMKIRREAAKNDLKLWEVAEACGMTDSTFSRKLRRELPSEQRNHILKVIAELLNARGCRLMETIDRVTSSVAETAAALGVSRPTVYALLHKRGFPCL